MCKRNLWHLWWKRCWKSFDVSWRQTYSTYCTTLKVWSGETGNNHLSWDSQVHKLACSWDSGERGPVFNVLISFGGVSATCDSTPNSSICSWTWSTHMYRCFRPWSNQILHHHYHTYNPQIPQSKPISNWSNLLKHSLIWWINVGTTWLHIWVHGVSVRSIFTGLGAITWTSWTLSQRSFILTCWGKNVVDFNQPSVSWVMWPWALEFQPKKLEEETILQERWHRGYQHEPHQCRVLMLPTLIHTIKYYIIILVILRSSNISAYSPQNLSNPSIKADIKLIKPTQTFNGCTSGFTAFPCVPFSPALVQSHEPWAKGVSSWHVGEKMWWIPINPA